MASHPGFLTSVSQKGMEEEGRYQCPQPQLYIQRILTQFGKEDICRHKYDVEVGSPWVVKVGAQADDKDSYKQTAELFVTEEERATQ